MSGLSLIIPGKDAAAHLLRRIRERRWSSMRTGEWFPISSCSPSLPTNPHPNPHAPQKESERSRGRGLQGNTGRRRALITDAQRGLLAVAPAAGHLGASLTPTLSKNKKIRKENRDTISPMLPPGPWISGREAQMGLSHLDLLNLHWSTVCST